MDRAWYREVLEEPDPERQLRLNARNARAVKTRIAALLDVIRQAAPVDADIEALWERIQTRLLREPARDRESLDAQAGAAPGLDATRATDILWTLNHPDVWQLLVGQRGWTPAQYEQWFAETACAQLLAPRS